MITMSTHNACRWTARRHEEIRGEEMRWVEKL